VEPETRRASSGAFSVDCADHPTICVVDEALRWFVVECQDLHVSEGAGEVAVVVDALQTETAGPLAVWLLHDPNPRRGVYQMPAGGTS
jgi:hypothetical protein